MLKSFFNRKEKKEDFDIKDIKIKFSKSIPADAVQRLFISVGWQYREVQDIQSCLSKSVAVVSAWYGEKLIGMARATGDGVFSATIWDVAVRPQYQGKGIGKLIIKNMLTKLDDCGIPLITLYSEWAKKEFYNKLGFEANFEKVIGMYRYKK